MAVAARVVGYPYMAAIIALFHMSTKLGRSTIFNGIEHFHLPGRHFVMIPEGLAMLTEDIAHLGWGFQTGFHKAGTQTARESAGLLTPWMEYCWTCR